MLHLSKVDFMSMEEKLMHMGELDKWSGCSKKIVFLFNRLIKIVSLVKCHTKKWQESGKKVAEKQLEGRNKILSLAD